MSRVLGIDYGKVRTGLAVSDLTQTLARGLKVVNAANHLKAEVKEIIALYEIKEVVIGLSKKSDGSLGEIGVLSKSFGQYLLLEYPGIIVHYYDEAMSTKEVERYFIEMGMSLKKYKKEIDKFAAELILQNYLNDKRS